MAQIHSRTILHRDLKPQSILFGEKYEPQISNFCLSRFHSDSGELATDIGSPLFMPPGQPFVSELDSTTNRIDVFSYGSLLYFVFAQKAEFPRGGARSVRQLSNSVSGGERMTRLPGIPDKLQELITKCWSEDAVQRPSFAIITRMILQSFDFVLDGTRLDEYHEYQHRITSQLNVPSVVDSSGILNTLRDLGINIDSMRVIRV
jgi:serine/threonine protein kinase